MARRPRYRRQEQVNQQRAERVRRALERVEAAESTSVNEEPAEQLSDETHIPEDNRFTGTLRIDDDGMAYLNDRPLGVIEEVTQGESIGDAGGYTMRTGTIQATHIEVNPEAERLSEQLEELRTFTYRPYEPADLTTLQVGGVHTQPNTSLGVNSIADAWVNAPLRGITAEHIYVPEPAVPSWQDDIEREYRELYAAREAERADELARSRELERELAELERNAQPTITTEPMQVRNLANEIPQPDGEIPTTRSAIGGPLGGLLVGGNSVGRTGIATPRPLTFTRDEDDAQRIAQTISASMDSIPRYGDYSTGRLARSKSYTFDEEKVNTLMDTIRVVRAIMTKYHFKEEDVKKLGIEDLMREL